MQIALNLNIAMRIYEIHEDPSKWKSVTRCSFPRSRQTLIFFFPWEPLQINWKTIEIDKSLCKSKSNPYKSVKIYEKPRKSMKIHVSRHKSIEIHTNP